MFDFGKTLTLQGLLAVVIAMLILSPALATPIAPPSDPSHYHSDQIVFDPADPVWEGTDWFAVAEHYNSIDKPLWVWWVVRLLAPYAAKRLWAAWKHIKNRDDKKRF